METKTLYLGLRPWEGTFHYPVIRTEMCEPAELEEALRLWPEFSHVIFTSQTAVEYWPGPWDKIVIAIGEPTASVLRMKKLNVLVAPFATQEGVMTLIAHLRSAYFFLPHSKKARPELVDFLKRQQVRHFALPLYDTHFQCPEPIPNLDDFDEIVFTSPSTVEGFLRIFKQLPEGKTLTPMGPITRKALQAHMKKDVVGDIVNAL